MSRKTLLLMPLVFAAHGHAATTSTYTGGAPHAVDRRENSQADLPLETYSVGNSKKKLRYDEAAAAVTAIESEMVWVDQPTKVVKAVPPRYPAEAKRSRIQGTVRLRLVVDEEGKVVSAVAEGWPHKLLAEAAVEAATQWLFQPHTHLGEPVKVRFYLPIEFKIDSQ